MLALARQSLYDSFISCTFCRKLCKRTGRPISKEFLYMRGRQSSVCLQKSLNLLILEDAGLQMPEHCYYLRVFAKDGGLLVGVPGVFFSGVLLSVSYEWKHYILVYSTHYENMPMQIFSTEKLDFFIHFCSKH